MNIKENLDMILSLIQEDPNSKEFNLIDDGFLGEIKRRYLKNCIRNGKKIYHESINVISDFEEIYKIPGMYCFPSSDWASVLYFDNRDLQINDVLIFSYFRKINNRVELEIFGDFESVKKAKKYFQENMKEETTIKVCWFYKVKNQDYDTIEIDIQLDKLPTLEMYPYFGFSSLEDYYDKFNNGNENILILIGPPGTGKTTFIRGLLNHTKNSCFLSYEQEPLKMDKMFIEWFTKEAKYLVLEDADNLLLPREDENEFMTKFLNISDGLISTKNKKIIFSTNLKNVNQIDPALLRPGRCFDILEFRPLSKEEANNLARKIGVEEPNKEATLAEIFAKKEEHNKFTKKREERRIGFL